MGFDYKLKHKAIQRRTNRLGKTMLFTSTELNSGKVLELYREKDVIDKTFSLMKNHGLSPLNTTLKSSTRARVLLVYLGYLLLSLLRIKLNKDISLEKAITRLSEVREVVYKDGSRTRPELTNEQKATLEKLKML